MQVHDPRPCRLGEGPFWHPLRGQLYWFDIPAGRMLTRGVAGPAAWDFHEPVSAAGWIDRDRVLVAAASGLFRFDLVSGRKDRLCGLGPQGTRSNDGRADPFGGFWIGTMGIGAERGQGAIWRYHGGRLRRLFDGLTIPNAICFTPDGREARFADTPTRQVMRVALDPEGWPLGAPSVFLDLRSEGLNPDGAVIDAEGVMWLALWGAGQVAAYGPDGRHLRAVPVPAPQATCPAFGGENGRGLFVTSALEGMDAEARARHRLAGMTFRLDDAGPGVPAPRVEI